MCMVTFDYMMYFSILVAILFFKKLLSLKLIQFSPPPSRKSCELFNTHFLLHMIRIHTSQFIHLCVGGGGGESFCVATNQPWNVSMDTVCKFMIDNKSLFPFSYNLITRVKDITSTEYWCTHKDIRWLWSNNPLQNKTE